MPEFNFSESYAESRNSNIEPFLHSMSVLLKATSSLFPKLLVYHQIQRGKKEERPTRAEVPLFLATEKKNIHIKAPTCSKLVMASDVNKK